MIIIALILTTLTKTYAAYSSVRGMASLLSTSSSSVARSLGRYHGFVILLYNVL
jgi:hypothetical protein